MMKLLALGALCVGATSDVCLLPVDVMILQDTTGSFHDDLPNVQKILPGLIDKILVQNPGSWFGASDFKDKPYRDLGEPDDHCYKLASPLTGDKTKFCDAYGQLYASGGGDLPEIQLQALINVVLDSNAGWRKLSDSFRTVGMNLATDTGARLIIMSTDAVPHDPKDYEFYNGSIPGEPLADEPRPPMTMTDYPNDPSAISVDTQCRVYDYPTMDQAVKILKDHKVNVVFLVPEVETNAVASWKTFNGLLGQPESFVQYIKPDSSDLETVVLRAMAEVSDYVCNTPTTTAPPTTTPETTTVPSTTMSHTWVDSTTSTTTHTWADTTAPSTSTTTSTTPGTTTTTIWEDTFTTTETTTTHTWVDTTTPTTTPGTVTTAGDTQTTGGSGNCPCPPHDGGHCPCPEVVIKLRRRPNKMHFDLENDA